MSLIRTLTVTLFPTVSHWKEGGCKFRKLIDARKRGKLAFFAMDRLIIKDKLPDRERDAVATNDGK